MGFKDFFKGFGSAIQNDVNESHGGFKNFAEGMLGGISDKFQNISPQQRWQMQQQKLRQEEEMRQARIQEFEESQKTAALDKYREAQLANTDENQAFRQQQANQSQSNFELTQASAGERHDESMQQRTDLADQAQANRLELAERGHSMDLERDAARAEQRFEAQEALKGATAFKPTVQYKDFLNDPIKGPVEPEEARRLYLEAYKAEKELWEETREGNLENAASSEFGPDDDILDRTRSMIERDKGVAIAKGQAEKPGASQEEIDEAEARKNDFESDFARENSQGRDDLFERLGSSEEAGLREQRDSSAGRSSSSEPALIEQDFTEAGTKSRGDKEIAQFRQLVEQVVAGDADAATQLGEITSEEKLRGFQMFGEEYGDEALQQLRLIYEQEMKIPPPF